MKRKTEFEFELLFSNAKAHLKRKTEFEFKLGFSIAMALRDENSTPHELRCWIASAPSFLLS